MQRGNDCTVRERHLSFPKGPDRDLQRHGTAALNIVHVDDAGEGSYGGAGSGIDFEAAGDGDFDFAGGEVEDDGDAATAAGFAGDDAFEAGEGAGLADEDPQPGGGEGDDGVEG